MYSSFESQYFLATVYFLQEDKYECAHDGKQM